MKFNLSLDKNVEPLFYAPIDSARGTGPDKYTTPGDVRSKGVQLGQPSFASYDDSKRSNNSTPFPDRPPQNTNDYRPPAFKNNIIFEPKSPVFEPSVSWNPHSAPSGNVNQPPSDRDTLKIFVGGLNYNTTDKELKDFFDEKFGGVITAHTVKNHEGLSRGFGFVFFSDLQSCTAAVNRVKIECYGSMVDIRLAQKNQPNANQHQALNFRGGINQPNLTAKYGRQSSKSRPQQNRESHSASMSRSRVPNMSTETNPSHPSIVQYDIRSDDPEVVDETPSNAKLVGTLKLTDQKAECETFEFFD